MISLSQYSLGLAAMGDDVVTVLGGAGSKFWDNHNPYNFADVVYYSGKYWKALRDISPPTFPALQSGEVPGDSDAWREVSASASGDILGDQTVEEFSNRKDYQVGDVVKYWGSYWRAKQPVQAPLVPFLEAGEVPGDSDAWLLTLPTDVLGMADLATITDNLQALTPITIDVARTLCKSGQDVIGAAIAKAIPDASAFPSAYQAAATAEGTLPGGTERKEVQDALALHASSLSRYDDKNAAYPWGQDLKTQVIKAYVDANSVDEGAAYITAAYNAMWAEIQGKLRAMSKEALATATAATADMVSAATGVPTWAWAVGGAAVVGILGFIAYKLAGPVMGVAARRYLP